MSRANRWPKDARQREAAIIASGIVPAYMTCEHCGYLVIAADAGGANMGMGKHLWRAHAIPSKRRLQRPGLVAQVACRSLLAFKEPGRNTDAAGLWLKLFEKRRAA